MQELELRYEGEYKQKLANRIFLNSLDECFYYPKYLTIETCNNCNARCIMCPKGIKGTKSLEIMTDELFSKLVNELSSYSNWIEAICLNSDGEPLIDKKLSKRIRVLKEIGIKKVYISTNGKLLTKNTINELLEAGLDDIRISIDAFLPETYEKIRRGLSYNEIVQNVLQLIKIRNSKYPKTEIRIRMVEMDENVSERESFLDYWNERLFATDKVQIMPAHTWSGIVSENTNKIVEFYKDKPCISVFSSFAVNYDGKVQLCDSDIEQQIVLGDVNNQTIKEIWQGEKFEKIRRNHICGNRNEIDICKGCDHWSRDFYERPQE